MQTIAGNPPRVTTLSDNKSGWTAGGGVQVPLNPRLTFDIQYLYTDLGKTTISIPASGLISAANLSVDDTFHEVSARLTWRLTD